MSVSNRDRAFIETENRCALCGKQGRENLSIDHIEGRDGEHSGKYDNLIALCHNCHHRKTNQKGISESDVLETKRVLLHKMLTPLGVNALKMAVRGAPMGVVATPFSVYHLVDLDLLEEQEEQMGYGDEANRVSVTARYTATLEGLRVYDKWLK